MQDSALETWLTSTVILLALATAGWTAWHRHRICEDQSSPRILRVLFSSAAFTFTMVLALGASEAANRNLSLQTVPLMALAVAMFLLIGMIVFGIADFWLNPFRPIMTRGWLAIAALVFGLLLFICVETAFFVAGEPSGAFDAEALQMFGIGAVAGIIWWSFLPAPVRVVTDVFE